MTTVLGLADTHGDCNQSLQSSPQTHHLKCVDLLSLPRTNAALIKPLKTAGLIEGKLYNPNSQKLTLSNSVRKGVH